MDPLDIASIEEDSEEPVFVGSPETSMHSAWYFDRCINMLKVAGEK